MLLRNGAKINFVDEHESTLLHDAVISGKT